MLWGGRNTANKYHWRVWGVLTVSGPHWVCPHLWHVCFPSAFSTLLWLQVALQGTGPGLHALPRSKPLRFRFSGTPQRHRLSWACSLCPSLVRAVQETRCFGSTLSAGGKCILSLPHASHSNSWVAVGAPISSVPCVSSVELISGCSLPGRCHSSPFEDNGLLFWVPDVLCQSSEVVLWNLLSVQMFFR